MAKVGYIYLTAHDDELPKDKDWMLQYGCVNVVEEETENERLRPKWHQLLANLGRGDELLLAKFSNAVREVRELSSLIELCRIKDVRIISRRDKMDSKSELFPETTTGEVLQMFGSLPEEALATRKASAHVINLRQNIRIVKPTLTHQTKEQREKKIVEMYQANQTIDDIWRTSGFSSRSSVFRILNKYGVNLNRGKFSGPLGPRKSKDDIE